ncbi:MAG: response regulator [Proteobacteria bacterium]|nr:response regulator [Pseudomonadota bacterium]
MSFNELRVLVVDDNAINRRLLTELFVHYGCNVSVAADGVEALGACAMAHFDLVCLDRHMPGLSGDAVVERLALDQLVLAWSTDLDGLPERFNGVLPKPITMDAVADAVRRAQNWRLRGPALAAQTQTMRAAA